MFRRGLRSSHPSVNHPSGFCRQWGCERERPERQVSGSADSGRSEILDGNGEILILVMAGNWSGFSKPGFC